MLNLVFKIMSVLEYTCYSRPRPQFVVNKIVDTVATRLQRFGIKTVCREWLRTSNGLRHLHVGTAEEAPHQESKE